MSDAQTHQVCRFATIGPFCLILTCSLLALHGGSLTAQDVKDSNGAKDAKTAKDAKEEFDAPGIKLKAVYSPPEHFPATNEWESFRNHAVKFLQEHPDDAMAPAALRDLILIEGIRATPNPVELNGLRALALLAYPDSLVSFMTLKTLKSPADFRAILYSQTRMPNQTFEPDFCRRFLKACELSLAVAGPKTIEDDDFLILISLAMKDGKSYKLKQFIEQKWPRMKESAKSVIELSNDAELKPTEKVARLHQLAALKPSQNATANLALLDAERFWMTRLSSEDRKLPLIREISIERLLEAKRFADASTELSELLAIEKRPKWMFWHAWCLAIELEYDKALTVLDEQAKQFPNDDWTKNGKNLAGLIRDQDSAYRENAEAILESVTELQAIDLDLLQIHILHTPLRGKSFEFWATGDAFNSTLDAFINQDSKPLVGYQSSFTEYSLFLRDQGKVYKVSKPGLFPEIHLGINIGPGGLNLNGNFNAASTKAAANGWKRTILTLAKDPVLGDLDAVLRLLRQGAKPALPSRMKKAGDSRVFVWQTPEIHKPEMQEVQIELFPVGQHKLSIRSGKEYSVEIAYGKLGSLAVSKSQWANLPVEKRADLDLGIGMRALTAANSIFQTEEVKETPPPVSPTVEPRATPPAPPSLKRLSRSSRPNE
jgi:hypothetical protein